MGIGVASDFKIYPPQFWGGVVEVLQTQVNIFNENSAGTLRLLSRQIKGDYEKESFLKRTTGLISNRANTSMNTVTDSKLTQGEFVGVKVNKRIGPVAGTLDEFKKIGEDPATFSMLFGQQVGLEIAQDFLESAVTSVKAAITNVSALNYDATSATVSKAGTGTLDHDALVMGMSKFGDAAGRLQAFVMHSKPFFDLMRNAIADKIVEVAGAIIYSGNPATFGKPVIVSDTPALCNTVPGSPTQTTYPILALTSDAVIAEESEERSIVSDLLTGLENLYMRIQGELAYNVRVKGCAWDLSGGGTNPDLSKLGTAAYWLQAVSDIKQMPGVIIKVK